MVEVKDGRRRNYDRTTLRQLLASAAEQKALEEKEAQHEAEAE